MTAPIRSIRRQLSLYVPIDMSAELESVRRLVDPVQSHLIPAHVTLCREDELDGISESELGFRLLGPDLKPVTLQFGRPEVFFGHGILLACVGGREEFDALRKRVLDSQNIRDQSPHITLAHPRNPKAPGNGTSSLKGFPEIMTISFSTVSLIEQEDGEPWKVIREFELCGPSRAEV